MNHDLLRTATISTLLFSCTALFAAWNLPYPQPAKYNYSSSYADDITLMVTNNPNYFKDKMTTKWNFFKSTFILSNGLVNHSRWDGSKVIGTNEAVSEGQGYGMLLAVLNNDQTTFNQIFQGANSIMWNSSKKSYFCWSWNGSCVSQGAAADADLDIGLALIFADKLVTQKYWTAFSNPDYKTRALEIIRSIRTNMCDGSGYLLAGDNWGGSSPQNPSYYAVAWMKVFNAYCKANNVNDIDYTPVIAKCYEVLGKVSRYNKGQAPDWCNTSGGVFSGKSYGMGSDAIRTPWRIAMDALWYNDSRAVAYCNNIKNTLTQYTNSNAVTLIPQMGQYNDQGTVVAETQRCNEIGLWMCGALGSSDAAFKKGVFRQRILLEMQGDYASFGSPTYSDDKFYFKQATAGLAYMAFTGMFPNVWDDTFSDISTVASKPVAARAVKTTVSGSSVTVSGLPAGAAAVELYSVNGQKRAAAGIASSGNSCSINTAGRLAKGTYILTITGNSGDRTHPVVSRFTVQ
jgi:endo-1,4-beta-D-glucanase Y